MLGVAHALIHAGARAAISTLWDVYDLSAALLVRRLYAELSVTPDPATALHRAQRWLSRATTAELLEDVATTPTPLAFITAITRIAKDTDSAARPFEHPLDWGAFTYLGP